MHRTATHHWSSNHYCVHQFRRTCCMPEPHDHLAAHYRLEAKHLGWPSRHVPRRARDVQKPNRCPADFRRTTVFNCHFIITRPPRLYSSLLASQHCPRCCITNGVPPRGSRRARHIDARTLDTKAQRHHARRAPRRQEPLVMRSARRGRPVLPPPIARARSAGRAVRLSLHRECTNHSTALPRQR